jgi:hypothetical protein
MPTSGDDEQKPWLHTPQSHCPSVVHGRRTQRGLASAPATQSWLPAQLSAAHSQWPLVPHCVPTGQLVAVQGRTQLAASVPSRQQASGRSLQTRSVGHSLSEAHCAL